MFKDFLTTEGERLLAKSIAGTATITFTKMQIGDGDRGTSTKTIQSLENPKMTLDIYSVLLTGDNNIEITTILDSEAISDGFYFREKGIYATDGTTEILFMYGTSGSLGEWMENVDSAVFSRTIRTIVTLSESDNVNITIQKGAYASGQDAENILTAIQDIKVNGDWAKYSQAENILSILDNLVASYTALRAGKLDNLDALISSRAPANTALSNAVWTNGRAGLLDNLDAKISSRAPASTALSNAVWTNARAGYLDNLINATHGLSAIMTKLNSIVSKMGVGDFYGRTLQFTGLQTIEYGKSYTYTNEKGGLARLTIRDLYQHVRISHKGDIIVDGVYILEDGDLRSGSPVTHSTLGADMESHEIYIPFNKSITIAQRSIALDSCTNPYCSKGDTFSLEVEMTVYLNK